MMIIDRFWSKVDIKSDSECWEWTRCLLNTGYGVFRIDKNTGMHLSHRVAWMLENGEEIPVGMYVCHKCDNPKCCNPSHLWIGTHKDNQMDMGRKGRTYSHAKKLSDDQVREIRKLASDGISNTSIAIMFGVNRNTVSRIVSRVRRWLVE